MEDVAVDVVSYRGPDKSGGVSSTFTKIWKDQRACLAEWWHLRGNNFAVQGRDTDGVMARLPDEIVAGHYRYCNEFLWPIMHDLPQYAIFRAGDRRHYLQFNLAFAEQIEQCSNNESRTFFVQDYQLALIPSMVSVNPHISTLMFWHVPWPRQILEIHLPPILEIARALLSSRVIGFHTREYAINFLRFIEENFPQSLVDYERLTIKSDNTGLTPYGMLPLHIPGGETQMVVAPLGVDLRQWNELLDSSPDEGISEQTGVSTELPYILSVDRVDYTKGVFERLQSIDCFFERRPEWVGRVRFIQLSGRTRPGLPIFDAYWAKCLTAAWELRARWRTSDWTPLVWLDSAVSPEALAKLYRDASVMLVTPLRDGLNLTAKEFVACQQFMLPGVLALSPGAGCWHELGHYSLPANPLSPDQLVESLQKALTMSRQERCARLQLMKDQIAGTTTSDWWLTFEGAASTARAVRR